MKASYLIVLHIINIFFLIVLGVFTVAMFANIASGAPFPLNPVNIGLLVFLLLVLITNYIIQLKHKRWMVLIIGTVLYIAIFIFSILIIYPFLYGTFYN